MAAVAGAYYGKRVASPIMSRVWVAGPEAQVE